MDIIIKASAVAVISAICCLLIKKSNGELAYALSVLAAVLICVFAVNLFSDVAELIRSAINRINITSAVFTPVIKCAGIAVIVKIIGGLCKDAGQSGTAASIEYLGAAAAVYTSLPLMKMMLELLGDMA